MNDLTILYYTANVIKDSAAEKIRDNLLKVTENKFPIISVSQKPIDFGKNICIGEIGRSKYNLYKQILTGVREVKTKYIACAEDDTLYSMDHFMQKPKNGVFSYETNMWFAGNVSYWRLPNANQRSGMWGCVSKTKDLLKNLTARYKMYPTDPLGRGSRLVWGEPGAADKLYGLKSKLSFFESKEPCVVFLHEEAMGTRRIVDRYNIHKPENMTYNLARFGGIGKLWRQYWS
jgi:hypothetical protein